MHQHGPISPKPSLCRLLMKSNPSWSETIRWTIPLMYRCRQLCHEIVIAGLWASSSAEQCAINTFYEAAFAKKKKRRKPIHLNLAGVCFKRAHSHTCKHSHTPPLLYFTSLKYSVCLLPLLHTHSGVFTKSNTHTVSIPLLFFVWVAVYYRSQVCNCVGVAYFLRTSLLFHFFIS